MFVDKRKTQQKVFYSQPGISLGNFGKVG